MNHFDEGASISKEQAMAMIASCYHRVAYYKHLRKVLSSALAIADRLNYDPTIINYVSFPLVVTAERVKFTINFEITE